ncbi:MAG: sialate O-acetylesterase [Lachnospiraceae bacterium]|nr:sialate O-acetylesterase [Lachnospiraceae bacterium]
MENQLKIPKLLGDNCVLQRGAVTRVWGEGAPGALVDIALLAQSSESAGVTCKNEDGSTAVKYEQEGKYIVARCAATAGETGVFNAYFDSLCAGGPYCLRFLSGEEEAVSRNVYVGDVFVCAGQSNMELPMRRVRERYPEEFLEAGNAAYLSDDGNEACGGTKKAAAGAVCQWQALSTDRSDSGDIREGALPCVHVYKVQEDYDFKQEATEHKNAQWGICSPDQLAEVSAFSYFLGKELSEEKGVPIGILNLSLGGTPIQAWMSEEGLKNWPQYLEERKTLENEEYCRKQTEQYMEKELAWRREIRVKELPWKDEYIKRGSSVKGGNAEENCVREGLVPDGVSQKSDTAAIHCDENRGKKLETGAENKGGDWKTISLPGFLAEAGLENFCGTLLLRKKFQVSEACAGKEALLRLGTLTDADRTYVNGVFAGDTGYCYPPRRYTVPAGVLKAGENEILIYLTCRNGGGRMTKGKTIELAWEDVCSDSWVSNYAVAYDAERSEDGCRNLPQKESRKSNGAGTAEHSAPISLAGLWEYQILSEVGPAPEQVFLNRGATGLFHGMVAPCLPYTVSGAVWYQGESNDCKPEEYQRLLPDMIADWRKRWMQEKLPFVIVQLPNCGIDIAKDDAWPQIREAQRLAGSLPDVAVTVNIDIGEDNDLHPLNKKEAAHRAVLALRRIVYHEDVVSEGPRLVGYRESAPNAERFYNRCCDLPPTERKGSYTEAVPNAECFQDGLILQFDQELGILDCVTGKVFPADLKGGEDGQRSLPFEFAGKDGIWQPLDAAVSGKEIALVPGCDPQREAFSKYTPQADVDVRECALPFQIRYAWSSAPGRYLLAAVDDGETPENGGSKLPVSPFLLKLVPDKEKTFG